MSCFRWTDCCRSSPTRGAQALRLSCMLQMQRARHTGGGPEDEAATGAVATDVDVTYHTPEWHAARIAALTVERIPYEDWKKKQKEEAARQALLAGDEEQAMREYRAQVTFSALRSPWTAVWCLSASTAYCMDSSCYWLGRQPS